MEKEIITGARTGDSCIHVKHSSGLDIYICEMNDFSSIEAIIGTRYGSVNNIFKNAADSDYTTVPEGIAHFLEHKLFENEDCGVFELYAKTGASGNAFTAFDKTCYTFSCSKNYEKNLEILLDFVQKPYFTKENVDKEMGIIGQEIKMTNDNPEWRVFFNMLRCMFHAHPIKTDIAGTVESISKIDADLLYKCYDAFYNLNNMVLAIAGNIKADTVLEICDRCLRPTEDKGLETVFPDEPAGIVQPEFIEKQPVGASIFQLGYKCTPSDGAQRLKDAAAASTAAALLTDPALPMCERLLKEEIINSTFGGEVFCGSGYFTVFFSGESDHPQRIREAVNAEIERLISEGIREKDFQRIKKSSYGMLIRELNNVEAVASLMLCAHMDEVGPYDAIEALSDLTGADVIDYMRRELRPDRCVLSVIEKEA
ncbi:EF-P 5-aminopentanol modification-associated protein YfmH [uncultured Ruminococcus sp.]|uniref:EF-P 5-aminopentanol modification-associated protein YfmH n=1 Tax=uncultured Ruminococcus sp. TaxID=165186 RepID=UPI00261B3DCD|nr:pitrilysin family protein [uncultured Ruminococcus sp.]